MPAKKKKDRLPAGTVRVWTTDPKSFVEFRRSSTDWCAYVDRLLHTQRVKKVNLGLPQGHRYAVVSIMLGEDGLPTATNIRESYRSIRSISSLNAITDPAVRVSKEIVQELKNYLQQRQSHL